MCLSNAKYIGCSKDFTVYKVFILSDECLHSPYYNYEWGHKNDLGKVVRLNTPWPFFSGYNVHGNSFHSFKSMIKAELEAIWNSRSQSYTLCVAECTIPADSKFLFEGKFGDAISYASECIRIDKIVSVFKDGKKQNFDEQCA